MLWIRRLVALSQLAGGALLIAVELAARGRGVTLPAWHVALAVLLGAASGVAGVLLWRESPLGRRVSLVIQALQVVQFDMSIGSYAVVAGLRLAVFVAAPVVVGTTSGFLGMLTIGPNAPVASGAAPWQIVLNLAALAAVVFLFADRAASPGPLQPEAPLSRPPA